MEKPTADSAGDEAGLKRRHEELERAVAALDRRLSLTPDEQVERTRLKKEKLMVKDRLSSLSRAESERRAHAEAGGTEE